MTLAYLFSRSASDHVDLVTVGVGCALIGIDSGMISVTIADVAIFVGIKLTDGSLLVTSITLGFID